jgi:hypothetical protein
MERRNTDRLAALATEGSNPFQNEKKFSREGAKYAKRSNGKTESKALVFLKPEIKLSFAPFAPLREAPFALQFWFPIVRVKAIFH